MLRVYDGVPLVTGSAMIKSPVIITHIAKTFPSVELGYVSPYPTYRSQPLIE